MGISMALNLLLFLVLLNLTRVWLQRAKAASGWAAKRRLLVWPGGALQYPRMLEAAPDLTLALTAPLAQAQQSGGSKRQAGGHQPRSCPSSAMSWR